MREVKKILVTLFFLYLAFFVFASPVFPQGLTKFGSHLAGFNSPQMLVRLRQAYEDAGVSDWVPATVMVSIGDGGEFLSQLLDSAKESKIWPILRLDGMPHGARIKTEDIDKFVQSLTKASSSASSFPWPIYVEFANEPNMHREWQPQADPVSYTQSLEKFIEKVPPPFQILNGAMNISASDPADSIEAITFWENGPKSLLSKLSGLAFNPYELGGEERLSIDSWQWELDKLGNPQKPIFLLEFGLSPNSDISKRKEFLQREYSVYLGDQRPQFNKVQVITPLFCADLECHKIEIPIFGFNGSVSFIDPTGGSSIVPPEEGEEEEKLRCGQPGGIGSLPAAYEMAKCAEEPLRPQGLPLKRSSGFVCDIVKYIPGIGGILCPFRDVSLAIHSRLIPQTALVIPSPFPEDRAEAAALGEVKGQSVIDDAFDFFLSLIDRTSSEEKSGFYRQYHPYVISSPVGSTRTEIIDTTHFSKKMISPRVLGSAKPPSAPEPPGIAQPSSCECLETEGSLVKTCSGEGCTSGLADNVCQVDGDCRPSLWYTIDYRNANIKVEEDKKQEVIDLVLSYWPDSPIKDKWDYVYKLAKANSWNPAFVIALWIEESGASGHPTYKWDLGCQYGKSGQEMPQRDLESQLTCLFSKPYTDPDNFEEFMCKYGPGKSAPCTFETHPNFPRNLKAWYDKIIPPGTPGGAQPL